MSFFKCKMCGGTLEITNETVAVCEYCGTKQTLPNLSDDRKANLYDRANHFRRNNEFDKAMGIYEQILNDDNTDAETYWSLVLCRYGIEYVEDPSSHRRVPTVNRTQFTSIFDDEDYKAAIQYADSYQREIYEQEAAAINEIQKGILAISSQEDPFDVFICYKETDRNGRRTPDSVLATELYHELTREGYKVFFSRITLEDKLGTAYEPYIFAALNSAKVMVVLGTKPEHFNAVWVKNEWSRYLALIKNGARKMLIPAYKDMDPYDLPEEFSHLQAQDMSKLGFMQDLIRGIKKIVDSLAEKQAIHETIIANDALGGNVTALLKRGFLALEDGEWAKADNFFEQALNQNAELAEAYLGKLMAELQVRNQDSLKDCAEPFDNRKNYQKAVRFADAKLKAFLSDTILFIKDRNENTRLSNAYSQATRAMNSAASEESYLSAAKQFDTINGYKDAAVLAEECRAKAVVAHKNAVYEAASEVLYGTGRMHRKQPDVKAYEGAIKQFQSLNGWKDSDAKILLCKQKIEELNIQLEQARIAKEQENARLKAVAEANSKKIRIVVSIIAAVVVLALFVTQWLLPYVIQPGQAYAEAEKLLFSGQYDAAAQAFESLGNYKDSAERACEAYYDAAVKLYENAQYEKAAQIFEKLGNYKDSANMLCESKYQQGIHLTDAKQYEEAYQIFFELGEHANAQLYLAAFEWICVEESAEKDYTLEFVYDKNGRLVSQSKDDYDSEVLDRTYKYSYDKNGRLYKLQEFEYDGELYTTTTYSYDKYGKLIEAHEDWTYFEYLTKYTYDKNGYLVYEEQYKRDKDEGQEYVLYHIYKYSNDSEGKVLSEVRSTTFGEYKYEYTYDEHGFCVEHTVTNSGKTSKYSYDYDEYGRLVALTRTSPDGSTAKTTYKYKCVFDAEKLATLTGPDKFYTDAERLLEEGKYEQAIELFESLNGYKDSAERIEQIYDLIDAEAYAAAIELFNNGYYEDAILAFEKLGNYKDSAAKIKEAQEALKPERYTEAEKLLANGKTAEAAIAFGKLGDYSDSIERSLELWNEVAKRCTLAAGEFATMAIKTDGTVLVTGGSTEYNFSNWANLVSVCSGDSHYVGLKADGTVVATGYNSDNQCDVSSWKNIVSISAGGAFTVGLKADGTVVAVGSNSLGECNVSGWTDIIAVYAGHSHTIGLKSDGTVVATGNNGDGQLNVSSWRNIVDIGIGVFHTVGLKADGTVVAVGDNSDYQCNISQWKGIVDIAAGYNHTVGLKSDGTVVTTQRYNDDIPDWKDIVAISAGNYFTVGLKSDGTVVASGSNNYGQCNISEWKKIRLPD